VKKVIKRLKTNEEIENDANYAVTRRRQSKRRCENRRSSRPLINPLEKIKKLRKLDNDDDAFPLRLGERRQNERRQSRVALLSTEDIKELRKK